MQPNLKTSYNHNNKGSGRSEPVRIADIFNVISCSQTESTDLDTTYSYVNNILDMTDLTRQNINWTDYLHMFHKEHMLFNDKYKKLLIEKIKMLLGKKDLSTRANNANQTDVEIECDENVNHLNRFIHLNALFEMLNELNSSFNQSMDYQNYTMSRFQDTYLKMITKATADNSIVMNHWFSGLMNSINFNQYTETKYKSKYHRGIDILKNYLVQTNSSYSDNNVRSELIEKFILKYSEWCSINLINQYKSDNATLYEIFDIAKTMDKKNELFLNETQRSQYLNNLIRCFVVCWESYLNKLYQTQTEIDGLILAMFSTVDMNGTPYRTLTLKFVSDWMNRIKDKLSNGNISVIFSNAKIFNDIKKICPIISYFRNPESKLIIDEFTNLYNIEPKLLDYVIFGLNVLIKQTLNNYNLNMGKKEDILKITKDMDNTLMFISTCENKEQLWDIYFKNIQTRINNSLKKSKLSVDIINYEKMIFEHLVSLNNSSFADKVKTYLSNLSNNLEHIQTIKRIKLSYVDSNGIIKENLNIDMNKVDYIVLDKQVFNITQTLKHNLINESAYTDQLKGYLGVGKKYYETVSETKKFDWFVEESYINFNIANTNIMSTVLQYIIISNIANQKYTRDNLIEFLINPNLSDQAKNDGKKYLSSYIDNLIEKLIVKQKDDYLMIDTVKTAHTQIIDISTFVPHLDSKPSKSSKPADNVAKPEETDTEPKQISMTKECLSYLRILLLIKMFKENSTKEFTIDSINKEFTSYLNKYVEQNRFNQSLITIIQNLVNVSDAEFLQELNDLVKRDIIDAKGSKNTKYVYVV